PRDRRRRPGLARERAARGGPRPPLRAARRGAQDRGVRAALLLRPAGRAGGHARLSRRLPARPVPPGRAVRRGPRRDAPVRGPGRRLRGARRPDPPRAPHVHGALTPLPRVPAAVAVSIWARGCWRALKDFPYYRLDFLE